MAETVFETVEEMHMGLAKIGKIVEGIWGSHQVDSVSVTVGVGAPLQFSGTVTWNRPQQKANPEMVEVLKQLS